MKEIPLTQGFTALIDDEDLEKVLKYTWVAKYGRRERWYAVAWNKGVGGNNLYLHKFVLGTKGEVDHKDGNGLNCQKDNLRTVTRTQNMQNAKPYKGGSSPYKGVSLVGKKFRAYIRVNGRLIQLGSFSDEIEAAKTYDKAAREFFGEFARPNFEGGDANDFS